MSKLVADTVIGNTFDVVNVVNARGVSDKLMTISQENGYMIFTLLFTDYQQYLAYMIDTAKMPVSEEEFNN